MNDQRTSITLPAPLLRELEERATEHGLTMSEVLRRVVRHALAKSSPPEPDSPPRAIAISLSRLDPAELERLDAVARTLGVSRSAMMRAATRDYLEEVRTGADSAVTAQADDGGDEMPTIAAAIPV